MFLIKLIAAAFLVSINIFTFLLIKFQKNDRDLEVLKGVATGDTDNIDFKKSQDPDKKEIRLAKSAVTEESNTTEKENIDNTKNYSHVFDSTSSGYIEENNFSSASNNQDDDDEDEEDFDPDSKPAPLSKKQKKKEKKLLLTKYGKKPVRDIKLLFCALLGGSLGIYLALFLFRYRLRDIVMMVLIPTFLVINIYVYFNIFTVWLIMPAKVVALTKIFLIK